MLNSKKKLQKYFKLTFYKIYKIIYGEIKGKISHLEDDDIKLLENELSEKLGMTVSINHKQSGKGSINVKYTNLEELEKIIANWK